MKFEHINAVIGLESFDKLEKFHFPSKNHLFIGTFGNKKYFIKDYVIRKGREKEDKIKIESEILVYSKLKLNNIKVLGSDIKKHLLILELANLSKVKLNKKSILSIYKFYKKNIFRKKAEFLIKQDFNYYLQSLSRRAIELERLGELKDSKAIIQMFKENKKLIESSRKFYSHGDMDIRNFKLNAGKLIVIDFEHSKQDNLMYDLATFYIGIYSKPTLSSFFYNLISKESFFDKELFDSMILRRCIEVMYSLIKLTDSNQLKEYCKKIINNKVNLYTL